MTVVCSVQTALYCWHVSDDVCGHHHSSGEERYTQSVTFNFIFQFGTNNLADVWGCERCLSFTLNVVIGYQCLSSHIWGLMFLVFAVTNADIACTYPSSPMYPFAFRTHTHSLGEILLYCIYLHQLSSLVLVNCFTSWSCCVSCSSGKVVSGYRVRNGQWTQIGRQSPLLPQVCLNVSTLPVRAWLIRGIYRGNLMHHLSLIRVVSHVNDPSVFYVLPAVRPGFTLSMLFTKVSVSAISSKHNIQYMHTCRVHTYTHSMHY